MIFDFKCPDCRRPCRLDTARNGLQHAEPRCSTYNATRKDGQRFLELAYKADAGAFPAVLKLGGAS